jgi:hypothetical protein
MWSGKNRRHYAVIRKNRIPCGDLIVEGSTWWGKFIRHYAVRILFFRWHCAVRRKIESNVSSQNDAHETSSND